MNRKELIKAAYDLNSPDQQDYYTDDFLWTDSLGSPPQDKRTWMAMGEPLKAAFPDFDLIVEDIQEEGDDVVVTSRFTGTFRNDLDLSPLGLGVVPATGKAVEFPSQRDRVSFRNGQVSRSHNLETGPDAGMAGFFKAVGLEMG